MAIPPFNPDETLPEDDDIASQYPLVERAFRDIISSWIATEHDDMGHHRVVGLSNQADDQPEGTEDVVTIWQEDGVVYWRVGTEDAVSLSNAPEATFRGRAFDSDEGPLQNLTGTQAAEIIDVFTADDGDVVGLKGLVPAPAINDAGKGKVLGASAAFIHTGPPHVYLEDRHASGTDGGGFTANTIGTRVLNTIVWDPYELVALATNKFTLQSGTYVISWEAPAYAVGNHQAWLYNDTTGAIPGWGTSEYTATTQTHSKGMARVTIASATAFTIRHVCGVTKATDGAGVAATTGSLDGYEVYTRVWIWKVG